MGGWYRDFIPKVELVPSRRRYDSHHGNIKLKDDEKDKIHIGFPSGNQVFLSFSGKTKNLIFVSCL